MSKKTTGLVLLILGVALAAVSLGADAVGLGAAGGIGWKQWIGAVVGLLLAVIGAWMGRTKKVG
jgi:hypothetical protein